MADVITLGALSLTGDLQWIDEYATGSDLVGQQVTTSVTGAQIIQASAQQAGRKVTLQGQMSGRDGFGAITRAQVDALRALAATPGTVYTLTLTDGRAFACVFRRDDGAAVEAAPLKHVWPPQPDDLYFPTIRLILV